MGSCRFFGIILVGSRRARVFAGSGLAIRLLIWGLDGCRLRLRVFNRQSPDEGPWRFVVRVAARDDGSKRMERLEALIKKFWRAAQGVQLPAWSSVTTAGAVIPGGAVAVSVKVNSGLFPGVNDDAVTW